MTDHGPANGAGAGGVEAAGRARRPWFKRKRYAIPLGLLLLLVVLAIVAPPEEEDPDVAAGDDTTTTAEPAGDDETDEPTTTTVVETTTTTEPAPIVTQPVPTTTTTTAPPPASSVYEGSGSDVIEIAKPAPGEPAMVLLTHSGVRNFIVTALDADLQRVDGLVNEIGGYAGSRPLDFLVGDETSFLEVDADGAWRIEVTDLSAARRFDGSVDGTGDEVLAFTGSTGIGTLRHDGTSNFIVTAFSGDGRSGLVNEIGGYDGRDPVPGPSVIEVQADGAWSIQVE